MVIGITLAFIGLLLLIGSMLMPWWTNNPSLGIPEYLGREEVTGVSLLGWGNDESTDGWSNQEYRDTRQRSTGLSSLGSEMGDLMFAVMSLVLLSMVLCGLYIAQTMMFAAGRQKRMWFAYLCCLFMILALIAAPVLFAVKLPSAIEDEERMWAAEDGVDYKEPDHVFPTNSFGGVYVNKSMFSISYSHEWGPSFGFYLPIIAILFFALSFFLVWGGSSRVRISNEPDEEASKDVTRKGRPQAKKVEPKCEPPVDELKEAKVSSEKDGPGGLSDLSDEELEEMLSKVRREK